MVAIVSFYGMAKLCALGERYSPEHWRIIRMIRLKRKYNSPLDGQDVPADIKGSIEEMFAAYAEADEEKLPCRMSKNMRARATLRIKMLKQRGLRPEYRFTDAHLYPEMKKKKFLRENDSGREWREATVRGALLERLLTVDGKKCVRTVYHDCAAVRIRQSRHISCTDRTKTNGEVYPARLSTICPSCGAKVRLDSSEVVCEYCGAVLQNHFYNWQTENFEVFDVMSDRTRYLLSSCCASFLVFVPSLLCFRYIPIDWIALFPAVALAFLGMALLAKLVSGKQERQKELAEQIVRYSENHLRSCIEEELWCEKSADMLYDRSVGDICLNEVSSTEDTTCVDVTVKVTETMFPEKGAPRSIKYSRRLVLSRAKYPNRVRNRENAVTEKDCPSCGANFYPDEHHCCMFCGYGLQVDNAKWVVRASK